MTTAAGWVAWAALALAACEQADAPEPPPYGSYLLFEAGSRSAGLDVLDRLDPALKPGSRRLLEAKGLADDSGTMMIRFTGACATAAAFVAEVRAIVEPLGGRNVRCSADLPGEQR